MSLSNIINVYVLSLGTQFPLIHHCHSNGARETLDWPWGSKWGRQVKQFDLLGPVDTYPKW